MQGRRMVRKAWALLLGILVLVPLQSVAAAPPPYGYARACLCADCSGSGTVRCQYCNGVDQSKLPCQYCNGRDLTQEPCAYCRGRDLAKLTCQYCSGRDLTKQRCNYCRGSGNSQGGRCAICRGTGYQSRCAVCRGTGKQNHCAICRGSGKQNRCAICRGSGKQSTCMICRGAASVKQKCRICDGTGILHIVVGSVEPGHNLSSDKTTALGQVSWLRTTSRSPSLSAEGYPVAENGSYYGEVSADTGRPKSVYVAGYFRKDGTYVQSHYRALPSASGNFLRGPPASFKPFVAENGSYYGEPNQYGVPKTVHVKGYYRKDGTYVRGHYRSRPRR